LFRLRLARRAPRRKRKTPGELRDRAEATSSEQASHPPKREAHRDRKAGHVGGLPERKPVAAKEEDGCACRADEPTVIREAARPELRPREAVGRLRMTDRARRVPDAVVGLREA